MTNELESLTIRDADAVDPASLLRRAPRIREEDVRNAADALLLNGDRPTVERVRIRLGRGSPNTIALFLDRWWMQLGARLRDLPGQELPGVPEPISRALVNLWSEAIDQARSLLKDTLAQRLGAIEQEQAALGARSAELEQARAQFAGERAALEHTVALVQGQLGQANERHRADCTRIETLQTDCGRLTDQQVQLRRELAELHARLESARIEHQAALRDVQERADSAERHWLKQVDEARQGLLAERQRAQALEKERAVEIGELRAALEDSHTERANQRTELARVHEAHAALLAENEQLKQRILRQEAQAEAALKTLKDAQSEALRRVELLHSQLRDDLARSRSERTPPAYKRVRSQATRTRPKGGPRT